MLAIVVISRGVLVLQGCDYNTLLTQDEQIKPACRELRTVACGYRLRSGMP